MSTDKVVYDLSTDLRKPETYFIRKDWVDTPDNSGGVYQTNDSNIDGTSLATNGRYINWREAYLLVPLLLSLKTTGAGGAGPNTVDDFSLAGRDPNILSLKNWFGHVIHDITVDCSGAPVVSTKSFINIYNYFKLMTTLSYNEVISEGDTIGLYIQDDEFRAYRNNTNAGNGVNVSHGSPQYGICGNAGTTYEKLANNIKYDSDAKQTQGTITNGTLFSKESAKQLWRSYVIKKQSSTAALNGVYQIQVQAVVYMRHLADFFDKMPLVKGAQMNIRLLLNNSYSKFVYRDGSVGGTEPIDNATWIENVANSGTNPLMIGSMDKHISNATISMETLAGTVHGTVDGAAGTVEGQTQIDAGPPAVMANLQNGRLTGATINADAYLDITNAMADIRYGKGGANLGVFGDNVQIEVDLSVGKYCLSQSMVGVMETGPNAQIYVVCPTYVFNPLWEELYLGLSSGNNYSSRQKTFYYTDFYLKHIQNQITPEGPIDVMLHNSLANVKSLLIVPFFTSNTSTDGGFYGLKYPQYQSCFDSAPATTAPLVQISNLNVSVGGLNVSMRNMRYTHEAWVNQVKYANSLNGRLTDGLSSGLFTFNNFQKNQCFYWIDLSRISPEEKDVGKSINISGTNKSQFSIDLMCFIEYEKTFSIDVVSGKPVEGQ